MSAAPPFIVVIPARLGSTRLPNKPLADLAGKPMVVRVADIGQASGALQTLVATDSTQIVAVCAEHRIDAMLTSNRHSSGTDRLAEVVERLQCLDDTIVVNVQGDEPLLPPALIQQCVDTLVRHPECSVATLAHRIHAVEDFFNPNIVKVVTDTAQRALYFSRAPIPYPRDLSKQESFLPNDFIALRHIGLYAYRAQFLRIYPTLTSPAIERFEALEQLRVLAHGYGIAVRTIDEAPPGGVDTAEDLWRVRTVLGVATAGH